MLFGHFEKGKVWWEPQIRLYILVWKGATSTDKWCNQKKQRGFQVEFICLARVFFLCLVSFFFFYECLQKLPHSVHFIPIEISVISDVTAKLLPSVVISVWNLQNLNFLPSVSEKTCDSFASRLLTSSQTGSLQLTCRCCSSGEFSWLKRTCSFNFNTLFSWAMLFCENLKKQHRDSDLCYSFDMKYSWIYHIKHDIA